MKICFYAQASDHLLIKKIINDYKFKMYFNWSEIYLIADNRTHCFELEKISENVIYLTDFTTNSDLKYVSSNNYQIAMKRYTLINHKSDKQERIYNGIKTLINSFFSKEKINSIFFPQEIQSMEGVMILKNAKINGVKIFSPHTTRLYNKSFFNDMESEDFYIIDENISDNKLEALKFIEDFNSSKRLPYPPLSDKNPLKKPFLVRIFRRIHRTLIYNELIELPDIIYSIKQKFTFLGLYNQIIRYISYKRVVRINSLDELPEKFIFFPLQISPEASLNVRFPFFKDQIRFIDLIRYNMPEDYKLIIREHPVIFKRGVQTDRDFKFYNKISKLSGVRVTTMNINTIDLIQKSSLTVSISGTAVFEAFLLGKTSFTLSETAFSWMTNRFPIDFNNFNDTLKKYLSLKITDKYKLKSVQLYLKNIKDFTPLTCEHNPDYSFSEKNISEYIEGIIAFNNSFYKTKHNS